MRKHTLKRQVNHNIRVRNRYVGTIRYIISIFKSLMEKNRQQRDYIYIFSTEVKAIRKNQI